MSSFFFSVMWLFSFPSLVARWINWLSFLLRLTLSLIPVLIFALFFYLKAYLKHTEPFRKKPGRLHVTSLFSGNNREHRPVCAKTISSLVRRVLCVAKAPMSLVYLWGAGALAAGVFLVSVLQVGTWARVST